MSHDTPCHLNSTHEDGAPTWKQKKKETANPMHGGCICTMEPRYSDRAFLLCVRLWHLLCWRLSTVLLKIFRLMRLCGKLDLKTNQNRSGFQTDVQSLMLVGREIVWLPNMQAPSYGHILWSISVYSWIIHTFISHCSGFRFDWNLPKLQTNQIKSNCLTNILE